MDIKKLIQSWPVYRQLTGDDSLGRGKAAQSAALRRADAAHRRSRPRRALRLPVLRGRVRAEGVREGREGRPDRGRTRTARYPEAACAPRVLRASSWSPGRNA